MPRRGPNCLPRDAEAVGDAPKTVPGRGEKNPDAVKRGAKCGKKGGQARAAKLSPEERSEIAK